MESTDRERVEFASPHCSTVIEDSARQSDDLRESVKSRAMQLSQFDSAEFIRLGETARSVENRFQLFQQDRCSSCQQAHWTPIG